ncbi:hypothetical protein CNR22_03030 [Sphingobacteriaceae bacterium]|nr:hypothetical protein CNR22_03030 [Sphingobacteriaceae bacterium]
MKMRYLLLSLFVLAEIIVSGKDQEPFPPKRQSYLETGKAIGEGDPHFAIKLNLTPLVFRSLSLQAEYAFHRKMSIALGASILPKRTLSEDLYNAIDDNPYSSNFSTPVYEGKNITPEFRFYPFGREGHSAPNGFYIAAYYRYAHYTAHQTVSYQDVSSPGQPVYTARATHDYSGGTGGLMIGKQWIIAKHFSIDWWIVGGGYGKAKYTYTWKIDGINLTEDQQAFVREQANQNFENFSMFGIEPNVQTTSNSAFMSSMLPMFNLRFMGICLGFAF